MNENQAITDRVLKYLSGEMGDSEQRQFEEDLQKDEDLQKELDFQSMLAYSLVMSTPVSEKEKKPISFESDTSQGKVVHLNKWAIYAAAASLIIVFSIIANIDVQPNPKEIAQIDTLSSDTGIHVNPVTEKNISSLAEAYFKREDIPSNPVGIIDPELESYQAGSLGEIIELKLDHLPQYRDPLIDSIKIMALGNFYKGIALYEKMQHRKSIRAFENVISTKYNDTLSYKSNWYIALNYVRLNDSANAVKYLKPVSTNSIQLYEFASKALLKKIQHH